MFDRIKRAVADFLSGPDTSRNKIPVVIGPKTHGIDPKMVPYSARQTCELLQERGFKAYVVGGAVRDLLIGATPKDFDVATDATPQQVKKIQRRAYIIGKRFRLVHVVYGEEIIECSTFRALDAEGVRKDQDGRVISDNVFGEMWEDAARRDFTVNAMYYDPVSEEIFDYHHGFEDIARKRIRMIGDPTERYREDPVRMMRAVRIAAKLGFKMEAATERAIPKMAGLLENVPAARLFDEMMKLFTSGHAEECLVSLRKEGLHRALLPMLDVILSEPEGEKFLMLALKRTDERIAVGKKISPAFMFCTLLWPQVVKRWEHYETKREMPRANALFAAADDVIATQCCRLAIQNRFVADMKMIWMMQLRFERRTGKNPFTLIDHPKYRAAYDFMLLRSLLGHVPAELVTWWETFVAADPKERRNMVFAAQAEARRTGDAAREGRRRKSDADVAESLARDVETAENERRHKRGGRRRNRDEASVETAVSRFDEAVPEAADEPVVQSVDAASDVSAPASNEHFVPTATGETLVQVETKPIAASESAATAETKKPVRRRKTVKPEEAAAESVGLAPAVEAPADVPAEEEKKPVRRRKTVKKAAPDVAAETPAVEETEEAPVKKTRRRKAAEPAADETSAEAPAAETKPKRTCRTKKAEAVDAPAIEKEATAAKPKRRRTVKKAETAAGETEVAASKKRTVRRKKTAEEAPKTEPEASE